jgi:hypothetical protein
MRISPEANPLFKRIFNIIVRRNITPKHLKPTGKICSVLVFTSLNSIGRDAPADRTAKYIQAKAME